MTENTAGDQTERQTLLNDFMQQLWYKRDNESKYINSIHVIAVMFKVEYYSETG